MVQGGMTDMEYQSMFALWCMVKAPLMLGADLRTITRLIITTMVTILKMTMGCSHFSF